MGIRDLSAPLGWEEVHVLAESRGILPSELSNALFWLNHNADSGEKRNDFRSGPEVIRLLLKPES